MAGEGGGGVGTVPMGSELSYEQDVVKRVVVAFASRGLTTSEKTTQLINWNLWQLKWHVTEKFHDYLYGSIFKYTQTIIPLPM